MPKKKQKGQGIYSMYVEKWAELFLETKNPLYAWRAFHNAMAVKCPVPEEVIDYLMNVAREIVKIAQHPPKSAQRPAALAKALKLRKSEVGQGSAFEEYTARLQNREIALKTAKRVEYYGPGKDDYAFSDIAKQCPFSKSKVRIIFLKHKERWHAMAQMLIESDAVTYGPDGKPQIRVIGEADDLREAVVILREIERIKKK
jgi:hypothetical protein